MGLVSNEDGGVDAGGLACIDMESPDKARTASHLRKVPTSNPENHTRERERAVKVEDSSKDFSFVCLVKVLECSVVRFRLICGDSEPWKVSN